MDSHGELYGQGRGLAMARIFFSLLKIFSSKVNLRYFRLEVAPTARLSVLLEVVFDPPQTVEVEGVNVSDDTSDDIYDWRCLGFPLASSSGEDIFFSSLRIFFLGSKNKVPLYFFFLKNIQVLCFL